MGLGSALAVGAGIVGSSILGARASKSAASQQARAAEQAGQQQLQQFYATREDLAPYRQAGDAALPLLQRLITEPGAAEEDLIASPGYQFRLEQGQQALERGAAARGQLVSGRTLKELQNFGQGMASQEYGNYLNNLRSLTNMGQSAAAQTGSFGQAAAQQYGQGLMAAGQARAQGTQGVAQNIASGIGGLTGLYQQQQRMDMFRDLFGG